MSRDFDSKSRTMIQHLKIQYWKLELASASDSESDSELLRACDHETLAHPATQTHS